MKINEQDKKIAVWIAENRGAMTEIAGKIRPKVSPQFVQMVLRGSRKSKDGAVERELRRLGAPLK